MKVVNLKEPQIVVRSAHYSTYRLSDRWSVDGKTYPPAANLKVLGEVFSPTLKSRLRSTGHSQGFSMASKSQLPFAQRALNSSGLTRTLFEIAERKKTNIVLSADLTTTQELLKIADGRCHQWIKTGVSRRSLVLMGTNRSRTVHRSPQDTY